jgi:hypothetical protein
MDKVAAGLFASLEVVLMMLEKHLRWVCHLTPDQR